ncbi:hypothetical protein BCR42DRAFT_93942 [Absidia repens]|uniref:Uncharacterized protein n=1 Tax=Absidia repens TaxID=90262 RepID=A0A1X2IZ72_9FUNG|nr:hypothetical protein BCR42DRAFT_93942 [Absidia repens]
MTSPTFSAPAYNHYQASGNYRPSSYQSTQSSSSMTGSSSYRRPTSRLHHRKSHSADLQCLLDAQQQSSTNDSSNDDDYHDSSASSSRHSIMAPKFHSAKHSKKFNENRHSLEITNDWMVPDASKSSPDLSSNTCISTQQQQHNHSFHHQQQSYHNHHYGHPTKPTTPPKHVLGHSQPMISTTLPTISNSTPLPGNSPPTSLATASQQYYYYRHYQYPGQQSFSPKMKESDKLANSSYVKTDGVYDANVSRPLSPHTSPKLRHLANPSSWHFTSGSETGYIPYNDMEDANNTLDKSLSATSKEHLNFHQRDQLNLVAAETGTLPRLHAPSQPPKIINIPDRLSFDGTGRRPASICIDTRSPSIHRPSSFQAPTDGNQEDLGEFLLGLQQMEGDVTGGSGHV